MNFGDVMLVPSVMQWFWCVIFNSFTEFNVLYFCQSYLKMNSVNIFVANSLNALEGQLPSGEPLEKGRKMLFETSLNNFRHCTSSLECIPIKAGFVIGTVYPYHPSLQGIFTGNIKGFLQNDISKRNSLRSSPSYSQMLFLMQPYSALALWLYWSKMFGLNCFAFETVHNQKPSGKNECIIFSLFQTS